MYDFFILYNNIIMIIYFFMLNLEKEVESMNLKTS